MASAWYYLGQYGTALRYFEQALEGRPDDEDTRKYINDCRHQLALPQFDKPFRQRVEEAWTAFAGIEAELRAVMDADQTRERARKSWQGARGAGPCVKRRRL